MPDGIEDFEKQLAKWEEETQLYQERAKSEQQRIADLGKGLEDIRNMFAPPPPTPSPLPVWLQGIMGAWYAAMAVPQLQKEQELLYRTESRRVKNELAIATDELETSDFFARLYGEVPYAISTGSVSSADEVLTLLKPPYTLTAAELSEVKDTISNMIAVITKPPEAEILAAEEMEYPELVAPKPVARVPVSMHQLTTQEIIKALKVPMAPEGAMTQAEWEEYLRMKGYDDEDIDQEMQITAEQLIADWQERSNQLEAFRTGIAEMPDYRLTDILKEVAVSPGLALAETAGLYFHHVSQPLAGHIYRNVFTDLQVEYENFRAANPDQNAWYAASYAWKAWDAPFEGKTEFFFKYMLLEGAIDPLSYIGWSIPGRFTRPLGRFGTRIQVINRGIQSVLDIPFDMIKAGWAKLPQTMTQRATMAGHKSAQYVDRYVSQATGKAVRDMNMGDFSRAIEKAVKFSLDNPHAESNIALAGRELLMHSPVDDITAKAWATRLGSTLTPNDFTKVTIMNLDDIFEDMFTRKLITPREAAGQVVKILHVGNITDDAVKLAQRMLETRAASIRNAALGITKARSPSHAIALLSSRNFKITFRAQESLASLSRMEAGAMSKLIHGIDVKLTSVWRNAIDKWVVRPFAEAYLTFGMYGPMNMMEDYMRSALDGVFPRRMNVTRFQRRHVGIMYDPNLNRDAISEMMGYFRARPIGELNNPILQIGGLAKGFGDKIYKVLVERPGHFGQAVRRNFVDARCTQIMGDIGGDAYQALLRAGPRDVPGEITEAWLKREIRQAADDLRITGSPEAIRGAKDMFTRKKIVRSEVGNIVMEHPELPRAFRDHVMKSYDDGILLRTADDIDKVIRVEGRDIIMDEFIRGPEAAIQGYHQLSDFLTELGVKTPQEMAQSIQAVHKMSEIYGALPDQIIGRAVNRSRGLPLAERRATFDADFDRIYLFIDSAGADIDKVIAKIRIDVAKIGSKEYVDASTTLFDTMITKRQYAAEWRTQNMAARHDYFAGVSRKEMTSEFWDNFYLQMNNDAAVFNVRMAELDGMIVRQIEQMNMTTGAKPFTRAPLVIKGRPLATQDVANLLGVRGDDISRALLDVLTIQNNRDMFVAYIMGMTRAGDVGFTKEAVGAVYDQIAYSLRVNPKAMSWVTAKEIELEAVRRDLHSLLNSKMLPDSEIAAIGRYFDDVADAVDDLMYKRIPAEVSDVVKADWKLGAEYEGRLFRGAYHYERLRFAAKDAPIRRLIPMARKSYNALRVKYGLKPVTDWTKGYPADTLEKMLRGIKRPPQVPPPARVIKPEYANMDKLHQQAMDEAHKWYYKAYPDYTHANAFDAMMKTIYPYWTYESQRWFWLPRAFIKHPGVFMAFERWQNNTDYGYIHIPGTSIDVNPFRGTVFGTLTTRLTRRDFPEYYDSLGAAGGLIEFNDYLSRFGFYPGAHIGIPLAIFGGAEQQMGETMPAIWKTPLNALIAIKPESESVKWLSDHIFSDRFRDYMTILEVNKRGYNGSHLWTKIKEDIPLTEEEQSIWDASRGEAAFYGIGFEQFGLFRLRTDEQYKAYEESAKVIEELTGYTPEQQDWLRRHGYRIWDLVGGLSPTNQAILQELESYKWLGSVTPLLPSRQQRELRRLDLDWDEVTTYAENTQQSKLQLQQDFLGGILGPREYNDRLQAIYQDQRAYIDKKIEENPNMTMEGRKEYYKKYGIPIPVQHPMRELLNLYFSIELNTEAIDEETGEKYTDWDTFFAQRMAIEDAILPELKEEWEAYLSRNAIRMEEVRRDVGTVYLRKYYGIWEASMEAYPEEEQRLIKEFLYLERTGRQLTRQGEIRDTISTKTGNQLISSFRSEVSANRAALRYANPHLDAWLFYWGRVTSFKTPQAEAVYKQIAIDTGRVT